MSEGTITPLEQNNTPLYGERGLLICGLEEVFSKRLEHLIEAMDWPDTPLSYAGILDIVTPVKELFEARPQNKDPMGGVAVIMSGVTGMELHQLMAAWGTVGLPPAMWATRREGSETWPLSSLIKHLSKEHEKILAAQKKHQAQASGRPKKPA